MNESKTFILAAGYDSKIVPCPIFQDQNVSEIRNFIFSCYQTNRIISSPNNTFIVAGNPSFYVCNIDGSKNSYIGHQANVTDVVCVEKNIYTCSEDCTIKIWELPEKDDSQTKSIKPRNQYVKSIKTTSPLNSIQVTSDNRYILVANERGEVELYDSKSKLDKVVDKIKLSEFPVRSIALSMDNKRLIAACHDGFVFVLSLDFSKIMEVIGNKRRNADATFSVFNEIIHFKAHENIILRCIISPDQQTFVTTSAESNSKLWNFNNYELMFKLADPNQQKWVWDAAYTNDSKYVVTGGSDNICRTWDINTNEKVSSSELKIKGITSLMIYYLNSENNNNND